MFDFMCRLFLGCIQVLFLSPNFGSNMLINYHCAVFRTEMSRGSASLELRLNITFKLYILIPIVLAFILELKKKLNLELIIHQSNGSSAAKTFKFNI